MAIGTDADTHEAPDGYYEPMPGESPECRIRLPSLEVAMVLRRCMEADQTAWISYVSNDGDEVSPVILGELPLDPPDTSASPELGAKENPVELSLEAVIGVRSLFNANEGPYVRLPAGLDLSGADLSGQNLCRVDFNEADMSGADFTVTSLRSSKLSGSNLRGAVMERADLGYAELYGCDLRGADLSGACLERAKLSGSDLTAATLMGANLGGAHMRGVRIGNAYLVDAKMTGADLDGARANKDTVMTGANVWETRTTDFRINGRPGTPEQLGAIRRDPVLVAIAQKLNLGNMDS